MAKTAKQTKRALQRARAEAKAEARRRQRRRRQLGWALGGSALVAAVVLGLIAFVAGGDDQDAAPAGPAEVVVSGAPRTEPLGAGEPIPDFSGPGLTGGTISWDTFAGEPAVIAVWAPWCPHCQVELPILDRVMRRHPDVGFVTVVTSIGDHPGPTPQGYMREHDLSFPVVVDDEGGTIANALGVPGFPMLYFVSSDGTVALSASGEVAQAALDDAVSSLS